MQVTGQRPLLGCNEPANLRVALEQDHRPASLCQLGRSHQPVDATPNNNCIRFILSLESCWPECWGRRPLFGPLLMDQRG